MGVKSCSCETVPVFVFPCSGAADVGEISDRAARRLSRDGIARMFCLAGIGGRVAPMLAAARTASGLLALDGCPMNCASRTLTKAGFKGVLRVALSDIGLSKGNSSPTEANVSKVVKAAQKKVAAVRKECGKRS